MLSLLEVLTFESSLHHRGARPFSGSGLEKAFQAWFDFPAVYVFPGSLVGTGRAHCVLPGLWLWGHTENGGLYPEIMHKLLKSLLFSHLIFNASGISLSNNKSALSNKNRNMWADTKRYVW